VLKPARAGASAIWRGARLRHGGFKRATRRKIMGFYFALKNTEEGFQKIEHEGEITLETIYRHGLEPFQVGDAIHVEHPEGNLDLVFLCHEEGRLKKEDGDPEFQSPNWKNSMDEMIYGPLMIVKEGLGGEFLAFNAVEADAIEKAIVNANRRRADSDQELLEGVRTLTRGEQERAANLIKQIIKVKSMMLTMAEGVEVLDSLLKASLRYSFKKSREKQHPAGEQIESEIPKFWNAVENMDSILSLISDRFEPLFSRFGEEMQRNQFDMLPKSMADVARETLERMGIKIQGISDEEPS
jgi:hypothetical protein